MIPRPPLNEPTLRRQFAAITQEITSHLRAAEHFREELALLKARASEAGLAKLFRELESPTPTPPRVEEPMARVRVRESFSGQWRGMPYAFAAGTIADVPASYAHHATQMFEIVPDTTELSNPAPAPAWPRDAAAAAPRFLWRNRS
jgi:hypothetical protein